MTLLPPTIRGRRFRRLGGLPLGLACMLLAMLAAVVAADDADAPTPPASPGTASPAAEAAPAKSERSRAFDSRARVRVSAVPAKPVVRPGEDLPVAVIFDHDEHWHIHTNAPVFPPEMTSTAGFIKAELKIALAAGPASPLWGTASLIKWPAATPIAVNFTGKPVQYGVFTGRVAAFLPVTVAADAKPGEAELTLLATYQACDERSCMAPVFDEPITLRVRIAGPDEAATTATAPAGLGPADAALFSGFPSDLWPALHEAKKAGPTNGKATSGSPPGASPGAGSLAKSPNSQEVKFDAFGLGFTINTATLPGFLAMLLITALGGLLLNFTPCVLPVIPLKIMGLSRSAGSRGRMLALGAVMSLGVVAFWLGMAAVISLATGFTSTNQLYQYPWFTIGVGIVIAAMAAGMCGLFTVTLPQAVYLFNPKQESFPGSFAFGIMTAVLSTPCTAPFMGVAAGWAVTQSPAVTWLVFAAIGMGMASPYMLLTLFPKLVDRLPRTGPGSELLKQVMGLLMLAAAAFFLGSGIAGLLVSPPEPPTRVYWWVVGAMGAAAGLWLAWRSLRILKSPSWRAGMVALGVLLVLGSFVGAASLTRATPNGWIGYTPERLAQARAAGKVVIVDFTAEWCLNCKVLEANVLDTPRVLEALRDPRVQPMRVDLTGNNPEGNKLLGEVGRVTIPTLVVFAPDGRQTLNADSYTIEQVLRGIEEAKKAK